MASHVASVRWSRAGQELPNGGYRTVHEWVFDGGARVEASSAPSVVGPDRAPEETVDPEEALIAATSSCHMLFYLHFAEKAGYPVGAYEDDAVGTLERGADGKAWITRIVLRPRITYLDVAPDQQATDDLHHRAHEACFIANSLKSEVEVMSPVD